jgi:undecaprenyl-diphosphatase
MDELIKAFIMGIVEGLTEFVPVSSTGHLIIAGDILNFQASKGDTFEIFIQLGAILAIVVLYWRRFLGLLDFKKTEGFYGFRAILLLIITTVPALIIGYLASDFIKANLFNSTTVAIGLAIGAVAMIAVELVLPKNHAKKEGLDSLTWREAVAVGIAQCCALWPGVSRAASTMVGGILFGLNRKTAAEFSFFAAVPVIAAASLYDLVKNLKFLTPADIPVFAVGFVTSFIFALIAVRFFVSLLGNVTLIPFALYRILVAVVVLLVLR